MKFVELTEEEFAGAKFECGSFLQSREMFRRYQALGREAYLVGVYEGDHAPEGSKTASEGHRGSEGKIGGGDAEGSKTASKRAKKGKIVAAGLILARKWHFGKKIMTVPGGWLLDYDGGQRKEILEFLTREAREFCRKRGAMMLRISPNIVSQPRDNHNQIVEGADHLEVKRELTEMSYKYLGESEQAKWVYVLEFQGRTPEELLKSFRSDHRQRIRRAERDGVRVRELARDELGILKEIAAEAGERHGFRDPALDYYRSMKDAFGDKVKFVVAEVPEEKVMVELPEGVRPKDGYVPLAASMFINDGREMIYLYSGSVRSLQKYGGAHLIQWVMMQEALESGCERYNFYGVLPVEGNGVYAFKQGFKGHVEELLGTFALPVGWIGALYLKRLKTREYGEIV